mmetsp:Transcript_15153/g.47594  ORF Transcript_15153/g.47594 Transcript_15153/m.47594 type:complete len:169 (-) Transcript_15153:3-509(-)
MKCAFAVSCFECLGDLAPASALLNAHRNGVDASSDANRASHGYNSCKSYASAQHPSPQHPSTDALPSIDLSWYTRSAADHFAALDTISRAVRAPCTVVTTTTSDRPHSPHLACARPANKATRHHQPRLVPRPPPTLRLALDPVPVIHARHIYYYTAMDAPVIVDHCLG